LVLGFLLVLVVGLLQPVIGDASLYASISKRMYESKEYFDLFLIDQDYSQKPHLVFWLNALSYSLFGINTYAFKLPSVLIALSGVYALYLLGVKAINKTVGFSAAIIWLFSIAFLLHTNDIHMDTMMGGFILWIVFFWFQYLKEDNKKWLFLGTVPLALAMMTKGPLGAFVPVSGFIIAIIVHKGVPFLLKWQHGLAILLSLVLLSPVLFAIYHQHGIDGIEFFFWENNAGRIERDQQASKDYFFYIHTFIWFFVPWALLSFYAFGRLFYDFFKKQTSLVLTFTSGCFFIFLIVASFADGRAPHYMYILLPFSALITAYYYWDDHHRMLKSILLTIPIIVLIVVNVGSLFYFPPADFWAIIALIFLVLAISFSLRIKQKKVRLLLSNASLITLLFSTVNFQVFRDHFAPFDAIKNATEYVNEHKKSTTQFYVYDANNHHPARADFYANENIFLAKTITDLPLNKSIYVLVPKEYKDAVITKKTPKKIIDFPYLLLTKPFDSISDKIKGENSNTNTMFLLDYTD